ncbi:hypothetical protein ACAG26_18535 [Mycobacterium sp. pUA109]|uniref:hypothetical protein n=1 Tax=Mycobacterium sp. pUA109 TaxID=3238982 RepID=UPI00351AD466
MAVVERTGTLDDVRDARRALMGAYEPPRLGLVFLVVTSATLAALGASDVSNFPVIFTAEACLIVEMIAYSCWSYPRSRLAHPRRFRLFTTRAYLVMWLMGVIGLSVMIPVMAGAVAQRGTATAYALLFVAMVGTGIAITEVRWRLDPYGVDMPALRKVTDQPAVVDALIEPRQRLMLCTILAGPDRVDARMLTRAQRVSDEELGQLTAELVAAHYLSVYPEGRRWWFGLTHTGRTVYRRHLRALLQPTQPRVQEI